MLIQEKPRKVFELPKKGVHLGVLADIIYNLNVPTQDGKGGTVLKDKITLVWVLENKDSEGNYFQVRSRRMNQSVDPMSDFYKKVVEIRGTPPPVPFEAEELIGSVNLLGVIHNPGKDKFGKDAVWANVSSVNPVNEGQTLAIPVGFVRDKDKDKTKKFGGTQQQRTATAPATTSVSSAAPALEVEF
jgi:hypothetical protein